MSNTDGLFNRSLLNAGNNTIRSTGGTGSGENNPAIIRLFLSLLVILFIVGADGMRVIFRNNFGKKGINPTRVLICAACFGILSYLAFTEHHFSFKFDDSSGTTISFFITGILFAALAVYIAVKGIVSYVKARKENPYSDYQGHSQLLVFLEDYGWNQNIVKNVAEPLYTVIIGVLLYFYNPVAGIPIIFCGISLWLAVLFELIFGGSSINTMQNEMQAARPQETIANQVNAD